MEAPKRKFSLLYVGVIVFLVIAIAGIVLDLTTDIVEKDGVMAIIAVIAAFLILAVFIIIDVILRKVREKKQQRAEADSHSQFNVPADQRFLRHSDEAAQLDFSPVQSTGGFDDGFDDGFEALTGDEAADDGMTDLERMEKLSPSMVLRRRAAQLRAEQEGELAEDEAAQPGFVLPEQEGQSFEPSFGQFEQYSEQYNGQYAEQYAGFEAETAPAAQQDYGYSQPASEQEYYDDEDEFDPAEDYAPEEDYAPATDFLQPEIAYAAPAAQAVPAAPAVVQNTRDSGSGQSLEAFYADMSEEDILYRDCVEVWAADAKPCVERLMALAEGIGDKQAKVSFGREIEYINAMIDRIYCFTQLEYVDELLELEEQNFGVMVRECLKRFSPFFMEKRLGLLWKGLDVNVMTDKRWFIFALTQVIFNSVEFTPAGGKIAISAKANGDYIDLMVDDSGKGISPEELPCVFFAGYMGDESPNEEGRRTGMGLFIAQSVLRKMGGDAFIESTQGKGARVTLRVPAIKPQK